MRENKVVRVKQIIDETDDFVSGTTYMNTNIGDKRDKLIHLVPS